MSTWFRSDWVNPFRHKRYNWIDFTFIQATVELDQRFGNFEFHFALAGLHFGGSFKVIGGDKKFQAELDSMLADIQSGECRVSITLAELNELRAKAEEAQG